MRRRRRSAGLARASEGVEQQGQGDHPAASTGEPAKKRGGSEQQQQMPSDALGVHQRRHFRPELIIEPVGRRGDRTPEARPQRAVAEPGQQPAPAQLGVGQPLVVGHEAEDVGGRGGDAQLGPALDHRPVEVVVECQAGGERWRHQQDADDQQATGGLRPVEPASEQGDLPHPHHHSGTWTTERTARSDGRESFKGTDARGTL